MITVGRLLRQHLADQAADSPERAAERIRHRLACEQVRGEVSSRWPTITADNVRDVLAYQDRRVVEVRNALAHTTTIEHETRGEPRGNTEHHLFHRWVCACGATGPWGHALWAKLSIRSAELGADGHRTGNLDAQRSA